MADGPHFKNVFDHNSATDCPILVKCYVAKQFSQNFDNGRDIPAYRVPQNEFFCFSNAVWALASGGFRIVTDRPIHLFWRSLEHCTLETELYSKISKNSVDATVVRGGWLVAGS